MARISGKTALITGASGGIGEAASERFCSEGASVIGVDINVKAGKALEDRLKSAGHDFQFLEGDVSSKSAIMSLRDRVAERHSELHILFNNAGIILSRPLLQTTEEEWDRIQSINLKSSFLMTQAFAPMMKEGSIVNVSSTGALVAYHGMGAYGAAKAGLIQLTRVAAYELAPTVRVNAICPGVTDTPMPRRFIAELNDKEALWQMYGDATMAKRVARPDEIVSVALFLASDEASYVSGSVVTIDSGFTIMR